MTPAQIRAWAKTKEWDPLFSVESLPLEYTRAEYGLLVCITPPAYAECQGPQDPFCGRCRFSVHGCAGAPSRAAYLAATVLR